jgi:RNA polymerase sigma-70 factor (ECF subfamily)
MIETDRTRATLLVRIRDSRDREAWGQFVEIYAPLVYQAARRAGLQDADASDLTQDVLRSVARSIHRLDYDPRRGTFRSWLYTITRNALRRFLASRRRQPRSTGNSDVQSLLEGIAVPNVEPVDWEQEYRRRLLSCAAERVRPSFEPATWQAFWQTAVEGRPGREVAAGLNLSVGAVYIARSRVLARLREEVRLLERD